MKNSEAAAQNSGFGRREFLKLGAGGAFTAALPAGLAAEKQEKKGVD